VFYLRIAAVALTALFVALLVWLYGVKTTLIWAGAMAAFLLVLWAVTSPLRARQRRAWLEMGLGPDGRPLREVEADGSECEVDAEPADAGDGQGDDERPAARQ
jgi:hypothetical protein